MIAREYPKIETLYDRRPDFNVDPTKLRWPEFWHDSLVARYRKDRWHQRSDCSPQRWVRRVWWTHRSSAVSPRIS
jgi:hypothetical protein